MMFGLENMPVRLDIKAAEIGRVVDGLQLQGVQAASQRR